MRDNDGYFTNPTGKVGCNLDGFGSEGMLSLGVVLLMGDEAPGLFGTTDMFLLLGEPLTCIHVLRSPRRLVHPSHIVGILIQLRGELSYKDHSGYYFFTKPLHFLL